MTDLEKRADDFVSEKADKGNYDYAVGDKVCFFESSMKQALVRFAQQETKIVSNELLNISQELLGKEKAKNVEQSLELTKAKELIKNIIRVTWGEGWNYSLDWKVKAEQFLKEEL